jgi:hypothetical protein
VVGTLGRALSVIVLAICLSVVLSVGLVLYGGALPLVGWAFGERVETRSSPAVVEGIQDLNQLATVQWTMSTVVTQEAEQGLVPRFLRGESILLIAVGDVQAGIDLDELGEEDVNVEDDTVTVRLPEPQILFSNLNEEETRIYDRDRGLLTIRGDDELIEESRRVASTGIVESSEESGILEQAEQNAEDSIRTFLTSLEFEEVIFE